VPDWAAGRQGGSGGLGRRVVERVGSSLGLEEAKDARRTSRRNDGGGLRSEGGARRAVIHEK